RRSSVPWMKVRHTATWPRSRSTAMDTGFPASARKARLNRSRGRKSGSRGGRGPRSTEIPNLFMAVLLSAAALPERRRPLRQAYRFFLFYHAFGVLSPYIFPTAAEDLWPGGAKKGAADAPPPCS